MKLYHAVASECGEDGTQLINLGIYDSKAKAIKRIRDTLNYNKKYDKGTVVFQENRYYETDELGKIVYDWVADIIPINISIS